MHSPSHGHRRRRLALALLLAGGVTLALGADREEDSYFDPLPKASAQKQAAPKPRKADPPEPPPPPQPPREAAPVDEEEDSAAEVEEDFFALPPQPRAADPEARAKRLPGGLDREGVFADVAEKALPSVVSVMRRRGGGADGGANGGLGSGVISGPPGYVLTNTHVVAGARDLRVRLYDGREFDAEKVAADEATDVAVIRIKAGKATLKELKPMALGNSDRLRVGEWVVAIGSPYGLSETVTTGIVSAKGRRNTGLSEYGYMIQTDAAINPGNSGGALLNLEGELVGINTAIVSRSGGSQGIGFAIPVNLARKVMEDLLRDGKVTRGWLGVTVSRAGTTGDGTRRRGARVDAVAEDGPGDKAGLRRGDLIVGMEDKPVRDADDLVTLVAMARPGSVASLEVVRGRKRMELDVKVGRRAEKPEGAEDGGDDGPGEGGSGEDGEVRLGMGVAKADAALRRRFGLGREDLGALVVVDLEDKGAAEEAGIRPGDVVLEADGRRLATVEALKAAVAAGRKAGKLVLRIRRDGETLRKTVRLDLGSA